MFNGKITTVSVEIPREGNVKWKDYHG